MRRSTSVLVLPAVAVALVTVVYGIGAHQPSSTVEPRSGQRAEPPQASSIGAERDESASVIVPERSLNDAQTGTATATRSDTSLVPANPPDEEAIRKAVRERAERDTKKLYSLLFQGLNLAPSEEDALLSLLTELQLASTTTTDSRGRVIMKGQSISEQERLNRIAAIIGESKLQKFLALEQNIDAYSEALLIESMLQRKGAPLAGAQRDELLKVLIDVREQYRGAPPSDLHLSPIEDLEYRLAQKDELQRHVIELAPSVLSAEQVQYLFEQYQYLSYRRAASLEAQKKAWADPMIEDLPPTYPAWSE